MNKIVQLTVNNRHIFEPSNKEDMEIVKTYLHTNSWGLKCPFILEWPYLDVPSMIKDKITRYVLK
jgi:hypothetical protein